MDFFNVFTNFSILPQIQLFINKKGKIENDTSHYVVLCGLSTLFSLLYWFDCYNSLNSWNVVLFFFLGLK